MEENFSFGYWLRRQRMARDLRQDDLAAQLGIATVTLRKLEADARRPSLQVITRIAEVLGLDAEMTERLRHVARADLSPAVLPLPQEPATATVPEGGSAQIFPRHLPRPLTPFIGRAGDVADLIARLTDPAHRLVTLVAPGGMGKTRLALAAAEQLQAHNAFPDGIAFVALAPLSEPAHLEAALADGLGLPLDPGGRRPALRQVLDFLREKALLIVLDNCEHLSEAVVELTQAMLHEAPNITILATSRERLGLRAEQVLPIDGMVTEADGVPLFLLSAQAVQPDLNDDEPTRAQIAAICRQVGGMPLAIELAAGWADTLSLNEIAAELVGGDALLVSQAPDLPVRHRSIRAVCDTSWERLTAEEQAIFARIAVFRGGGTRQAFQAVTGATLPQLQALVGKAFLRYDAERERYFVHEVLRQYAEERLGTDPAAADAARGRHAHYYLTAMAERERELKGAGQREALDRIGRDSENIHVAWAWAVDRGALDLLAGATTSVRLAYEWLGRSDTGLTMFRQAALASGLDGLPAVHARFLAAQAQFALLRGERQAALELLAEAQVVIDSAASGPARDTARAELLLLLGRYNAFQDYEAAHAAYSRSLEHFNQIGDRWGAATALAYLGEILVGVRQSYAEGQSLLERSATHYRDLGDRMGLSRMLTTQSLAARYLGRVAESLALARESYQLAQSIGNAHQVVQAGSNLGATLFWDNQNDEAYTVLHHTLKLAQELGLQFEISNICYRLGVATCWSGRYTEANTIFRQGLAAAQRHANGIDTCGNLTGLGWVALAEGDCEAALQLADAAIGESTALGEVWFRHLALAIAALAARRLGKHERARADVVTMLRIALTIRPPLGWCHWAIGLTLADSGADHLAAAAFALAERDYQFINTWSEDIGRREFRTYVAALPPQELAAARARWEHHDYWVALEELLAELESHGWGG